MSHVDATQVIVGLILLAAGGVGPDKAVVAFNGLCPHMGWDNPAKNFFADPGVAGPCAGHWTTFDLTRSGMVVSSHATQGCRRSSSNSTATTSWPWVLGLIFGFHNNKAEPRA